MSAKPVTAQQHTDPITARRTAIAALLSTGKSTGEILKTLPKQGIVNPKTGKAYSRKTVLGDLAEMRKTPNVPELVNGFRVSRRQPIAEMIGNWTYTKPMQQSRYLLNVDNSWKDAAFWDALRRGAAPGYEIGGLFCMPIAQTITSYVLGSGISASLVESAVSNKALGKSIHQDGKPTANLRNAKGSTKPAPQLSVLPKPKAPAVDPLSYTNLELRTMMERNQGLFQSVLIDTYGLGNQYLAVNPDCTFSVLSPDTVTVEYSASDYRHPVRYIVRTKMEKAIVEDVYTAEKRTITVRYYDEQRGTEVHEYENLIGRIPIVHFTCDRSVNEISGRPIYEAALPVMARYDDLLVNIVEGVKLLGAPFPAFVGLKDPMATKKANSVQIQYTDDQGVTQTEWQTMWDRQTGLYVGDGGDVKMVSTPIGFTKDSLDVLRQLFLLLLNHARIPEFIWGGAIAASKASTDSQMPPFIKYIQLRRLQLEGEGAHPALGIAARGGLLELIDIWLRMYKLLNPAIVVAPVRIDWPEIDITDNQVRYLWTSFFRSMGDILPEDAVKASGIFDDPEAVVRRASGAAKRAPAYDEYDAKLNKARLAAAKAEQEPPNDDGPPMSTDWVIPFSDEESGDLENDFSIAGPLSWAHMLGGGY